MKGKLRRFFKSNGMMISLTVKMWFTLTVLLSYCGSLTANNEITVRKLQSDVTIKVNNREIKLFAGEYFRDSVASNQKKVFLIYSKGIKHDMGLGDDFPKTTAVPPGKQLQLMYNPLDSRKNSFVIWRTNDSICFKTTIANDTLFFISETKNCLIKVFSGKVFYHPISVGDTLFRISAKEEIPQFVSL